MIYQMTWRCGSMKGEIKYCSRFNIDGTFEKNVIAYGCKILETYKDDQMEDKWMLIPILKQQWIRTKNFSNYKKITKEILVRK